MLPTLAPGDFVLVDPRAFDARPPRLSEVLVARHPYKSSVIVKRVSTSADGAVRLVGDNPRESSDSRSFGVLPVDAIIGLVTSRIV
jgi:nickel-type superoxide dismutase maturation protease